MKSRILPLLLLAALVLQGCGSKDKETEWGVFNEPVESAELPEPAGEREMSVSWKREIGDAGEDGYAILRPGIDESGIYVANRKGDVRRLDRDNGDVLWQQRLRKPVYAAVGVGEGLALVAMDDGTVHALDTADGSPRWEADIRRQISAIPVAGSGRVIVRTADGLVIGLDASDGSREWEVQRSVPGLSLHGDSKPLISGDTVITGLSNGKIMANAVVNGRDFWETDISFVGGTNELEQLTDIDSPPVLAGAGLYAATYQGDVVAVDISSSSIRWRRSVSTRLPMDVNQDRVFVTGALGDVVVIDVGDGEVIWQQDAFRGRGMTNPLGFEGRVVVGDAEGYLHLLDGMDGSLLQSLRLDRAALTALVRDGSGVIAVSVDGAVTSVAIGSD